MTAIDPARWSTAERTAFEARRQSRNRALGLLLVALVLLFFGITVVRMVPMPGASEAKMMAGREADATVAREAAAPPAAEAVQ